MLKFLEKVTLIHRETFILFFPQGILFKVTLPNQLNQDGEQGKQVPQRPVQARFQLRRSHKVYDEQPQYEN